MLVKPLSRNRLVGVLSRQFGFVDTGDEDAFEELVEILGEEPANRVRTRAVAEIFEVLDELEAALPDGALPEDAGGTIHRLAGLSALVGMPATHEALSALETAAAKSDATGIRTALANVRNSLEFAQAAE